MLGCELILQATAEDGLVVVKHEIMHGTMYSSVVVNAFGGGASSSTASL